MSNKRGQLMTKFRHSSLDLADPELKKKNSDVLTKARNKFLNFGDSLKSKKPEENQNRALPKSMTQCTLDYFFKHSQNKDDMRYNRPGPKGTLQKQTSVGSYPQIRVSSVDGFEEDLGDDEVFYPISRLRPATVCVDRPSVDRRSDAEALALERPRKKLSFKEPEVVTKKSAQNAELTKQTPKTILNSHSDTLKNKSVVTKFDESRNKLQTNLQNTLKSCEKMLKNTVKNSPSESTNSTFTLGKGIQSIAGLGLSVVSNGMQRTPSYEDCDLENQAMRIVRTVGQAFEVCHKLSINAPEDNYDDEQDTTLTQDLLSDRLSDVASDKPKKDITSEGSDRNSPLPDESSVKDSYIENSIIKKSKPPAHLDITPSPPSISSSSRKSPLKSETYASPHSDGLGSSTSNTSNFLPSPGGALTSHHELQLLREQLEQQRQQTQAAVAQLQLAKEQLQAEQSARMEAQARTHQLLVHNRELLDHIAALVAHLQGGDKAGQQPSPPHMTMPQQPTQEPSQQDHQVPPLDPNLVLQALGITPGVMENRTATTCQSPLRSTFNPGGNIFNFPYPQNPLETSLEAQILQRLQSMGGYPPVSPQYQYGYPQSINLGLYGQNYSFPPVQPPQYGGFATLPRSFPNMDSRINTSSRHSEPRQIPSIYQSYNTLQDTGQNFSQEQYQNYQRQQSLPPTTQNLNPQSSLTSPSNQSSAQLSVPAMQRRHSSLNLALDEAAGQRPNRSPSPNPQSSPSRETQNDTQFIKPLSQVGTLTTTDSEGRVRVIVPVPSDSERGDRVNDLRISEELRLMNGPGISRSASERGPNRSELLSQVQRTMWARHTTK